MAQRFSIFWITPVKLYMTKYIIGEIFSSGGATLYKNPSDQTVYPQARLNHFSSFLTEHYGHQDTGKPFADIEITNCEQLR